MRHVFILNPRAGRRRALSQFTHQVEQHFSPGEYEIQHTAYAGHAIELARAAAQAGTPVRIYACGGDGTLNEVVNGAAGYDNAAVTNFPIGTGNDFLRIFGDHTSLFRRLDLLKDGPQTAFDVMECNGKLGLGVICAGVDARVGADVHKYTSLRLLNGTGSYLLSLLVNVLFKDIARPMTVEMNDLVWNRDTTILCVCNGRYYGGGFMPVGEAMPDDGSLEVLLIPRITRRTFFRLVKEYAAGNYALHPDLIHFHRTTSLTLSTPQPTVVVVDGEVMEDSQFAIRLSEKRVHFFYPTGANYCPIGQEKAVSI